MRTLPLATLLLASASLGACSTWKPPAITYDDTPRQAVLQPDPPKPVQVVELPKLLPLPGQLKPIPGARTAPRDAADPHARVDQANGAARVEPTRAGYINAIQVYPYSDGALYQVYAAPGEITDVALEAGTLRVTGKGRKERVLPLTKAAVRWLGRYTQHTRPKLLKGKLDEPALWIDLHGGRLASPALDAVVKKCARKARLRRITVHTLRRACATHLLQNGAHPFFVKELLGHATMKHLAHYLRLSIADVKAMHRQSRLGR